MKKMSTICSRVSYTTGGTLTGVGLTSKAYAETTTRGAWLLADKIAGMSLSDWAIIVGIACTVITCGVNWYYRQKEREDRRNGNVSRSTE